MEYTLGLVFDRTMEYVLMIKRKNEPYKNLWNGIGGKIKENESYIDAMHREFKEETGFNSDDLYRIEEINLSIFNNGIALYAFYMIMNKPIDKLITPPDIDEGNIYWLNIKNAELLDASNPYIAGDGNIAYFIQYALKEEGRHYDCSQDS